MSPIRQRFSIFILGAGFSKPAGLPLAGEVWREVRSRASSSDLRAAFDGDMQDYIEFCRCRDGRPPDVDADDYFEDFLGFLDTEFYLGLRGSDTWSDEGNPTQLLVKRLIAEILMERTPPIGGLDLYLRFAEGLQPGDLVLTFNYDVLLERALDAVKKPYRLFAERYSEIHRSYGVCDSSRAEVVVLKLHGSADWFHRGQYRERCEARAAVGGSAASDPVFNKRRAEPQPIVEGPRFPDDPLAEMYRLRNINEVFPSGSAYGSTPWLLNPSSAKLVYAKALKDFWWGLGRAGGMNLGMAIVGYSLPRHDDYARQAIYRLVRNYQLVHWDTEFLGLNKTPLVVVDFQKSASAQQSFKRKYGFADPAKTRWCLGGFDDHALRALFP